jgi:hypothetical protein
MLYFDAVKTTTANVLLWATASESNSLVFDIEHSINGADWRQIGTVVATGNSTEKIEYEYADNTPANSINYYRLVQRDNDGQFKLYGPVAIDNNTIKKLVKIINLMGQQVDETAAGVCIEIYEDGTIRRVIR